MVRLFETIGMFGFALIFLAGERQFRVFSRVVEGGYFALKRFAMGNRGCGPVGGSGSRLGVDRGIGIEPIGAKR